MYLPFILYLREYCVLRNAYKTIEFLRIMNVDKIEFVPSYNTK